MRHANFETPAAVTVNTGAATTILIIIPGVIGEGQIANVEVAVTAQALNSFIIQLQDHPNGEFYDFLSDTDFDATTNTSMMYSTGTGPHELAAAGVAHVHFRFNSAYAVRFKAVAAVNGALVTIRGHINPA